MRLSWLLSVFFIKTIVDWGWVSKINIWGNSGIIILWEPVLVFCLFLFLVFQTKEWQPHPVLILNTFFLVATALIPVFLRPWFHLTPATLTMRVADCGCRGNMTKRLGFTKWWLGDSQCPLGPLDGLPACLSPSWTPTLPLLLDKSSWRAMQINSFPCQHLQWFLLLLGTKPCRGLRGRESWLWPALHQLVYP